MKKINFLAIAVVCSMVFTSCSSNDELLAPQQSKELLKTYQLKRDANGAYSIAVNVANNVSIRKVKNANNNTNELYLSLTDNNSFQKNNSDSDLWFSDNNFKINFISENYSKVPSISVFDDNSKYAKKTNNDLLEEYSFSKNSDGTYDLDFIVKNNVAVDFVYNTEISEYEIHLEATGKTTGNNKYARNFVKEAEKVLKITFVNHTGSAKGTASQRPRKPRFIVYD